jgi:hypothetical protein
MGHSMEPCPKLRPFQVMFTLANGIGDCDQDLLNNIVCILQSLLASLLSKAIENDGQPTLFHDAPQEPAASSGSPSAPFTFIDLFSGIGDYDWGWKPQEAVVRFRLNAIRVR